MPIKIVETGSLDDKKSSGTGTWITKKKKNWITKKEKPKSWITKKKKNWITKKNTSRMNELEELGRVDAERGRSPQGRKNLHDEKRRIIRELQGPRTKRAGGGMAQRGLGRAFMKGGKA